MRKRISEQNEFPEFDLYNEYRKIDVLLSETKTVNMYNKFGRLLTNYFTIEEYIEFVCFNDWNLRGTFTSKYTTEADMARRRKIEKLYFYTGGFLQMGRRRRRA